MGSSAKRMTVVVIVCCQFLNSFTGSAMNVAIPTIGAEFHAAAADLGWVVTAYNMCTVALLLPLGRLADLTNRRAIYLLGLGILTAVAEAAAWAPGLDALIVTRVIQGLGASCIFATGQAILLGAVPDDSRGRAIGWSTAAVYIGLSAGPVVGGFITHHLGWRAVFHVIAVIGLVLVGFAATQLPPNAANSASAQPAAAPVNPVDPVPASPAPSLRQRLDLPGMALVTIASLLVTYGLTELPAAPALIALAVGVALLAAFVAHERRTDTPLLPATLWRAGANFVLSNLSALLSYAATFAISYLLAIYLQQVKGLGADLSGVILITSPLVQAVISPWTGRLADRHSPFLLASLGMGLCAAGLVVFAFLDPGTPLWLILAVLAVIGFGFGLFATPNTTAIMSMTPPADHGLTNAFISMVRNLGMVCSMAVITVLVRASFGDAEIATAPVPVITNTMRLAFAIFAGICAVGVFTSLNRRTGQPLR
ncbi:MAG: MFS transporter [Propionibacteriaceae bacterium]|jgi:MFS family permease|nr:MFS transporter [Propionibacteriaceae bacterium]